MTTIPWDLNFLPSLNHSVSWFLMASYMYYIHDKNIIHDHEFDVLCKWMLEHWDSIEHQHKHLINVDDLRAGTGFSLKEQDYPQIVKNCAWEVYNERN